MPAALPQSSDSRSSAASPSGSRTPGNGQELSPDNQDSTHSDGPPIQFRGTSISPDEIVRDLTESSAAAVVDQYRLEHQRQTLKMPFAGFLGLAKQFPELTDSAHFRLARALESEGTLGEISIGDEKYPEYRFLKDMDNGGTDAMFGADMAAHMFISQIKANDRRIFVFYSETGAGKNTIVRRIKATLEKFSRSDEGAVMELGIKDPDTGEFEYCARRENPLHAIPTELRPELLPWMIRQRSLAESRAAGAEMEKNPTVADEDRTTTEDAFQPFVPIEGSLCYCCRDRLSRVLSTQEVDGDFFKAMEDHLEVRRFTISEADRRGISTFVPAGAGTRHELNGKAESNGAVPGVQEETEGKVTESTIVSEHIPETPVDELGLNTHEIYSRSNRGVVEFQEMSRLKDSEQATIILAAEDHVVRTATLDLESFDTVIIGHCTTSQYKKMIQDPTLRRRVVGIPMTYPLRVDDEVAIYERDFYPGSDKVTKHIAPGVLRTLGAINVARRIEPPAREDVSLLDKIAIYNGENPQQLPNDDIGALREEHPEEGMFGQSPAEGQNRLAELLGDSRLSFISPFDVLRRYEAEKDSDKNLVELLTAKLERDLIEQVKHAWCLQEKALEIEFLTYMKHVKAYRQGQTIKNPYTDENEPPDERLVMRPVEEAADISEVQKDTFRGDLMNLIGALALDGLLPEGEKLVPNGITCRVVLDRNEQLRKALAKKIGNDAGTTELKVVLDRVREGEVGLERPGGQKEVREAYQRVLEALISEYGYNQESARHVLSHVARMENLNLDDEPEQASD